MPLTPFQEDVLGLLADNRTASSHMAGAGGIHLASGSPRRSDDLDFFHDHEHAVAKAFAMDKETLEAKGHALSIELSQRGFIRAVTSHQSGDSLRLDWAHDSSWRFLPAIKLKGAGFVLHPLDLAVNKVLALVGREEPRDFVDMLYLHKKVLPLGVLSWAACGKDPGLNPTMILELLARKGKYQQSDIDRLDLTVPFNLNEEVPLFRQALQQGKDWIHTRPPEEAGCLYRREGSGLFFAPNSDDKAEVHRGEAGGVLPKFTLDKTLYDDAEARAEIESFFERTIVEQKSI